MIILKDLDKTTNYGEQIFPNKLAANLWLYENFIESDINLSYLKNKDFLTRAMVLCFEVSINE